MAGKSNSQQPSGSTPTNPKTGLDLIKSLCPKGVVDVVNYYLLNRSLAGKVPPIGGSFVVDGFRVNLQPDEEQRQAASGVNRYHVLIEEGEVEYRGIPSETVRPIIEQLRTQEAEFSSDVELIKSLMEDNEKSVTEQNELIARLTAEREKEEDQDRIEVIDGEIEDANAKIAIHESNLTTARAALAEKGGLLLNVSENLATELEAGEMEPSTRRERVNKQFPLETFVS